VREVVLEAILSAWERFSTALTTAQAARAATPSSALVNATWRFGVTVSSNDVRRAGVTHVQLKLGLQEPGGSITHEHAEMSLPQFYAALSALEKAQSYVSFLSGSAVESSPIT
jgi:hypothetical protein